MKSFVFFEAGVRFTTEPGFVIGADLPVYAFQVTDNGNVKHYYAGLSFAFSQFYVGWQWVL